MIASTPATFSAERDAVRVTARKLLRSEDLVGDERAVATAIVKSNPAIGNPHVVRCPWCRETRTLFSDESEAPLERIDHGWHCRVCDVRASSQEVKF
jgi:hypothetical protein